MDETTPEFNPSPIETGPAFAAAELEAQARPRFRPGFAWGLAFGSLAVVAMIATTVIAGIVVQARVLARLDDEEQRIVAPPVNAGSDWFTLDEAGVGTLYGWADGSGSAYPDGDVPGTMGWIGISNVGSFRGVRVVHSVDMYLTRGTEFSIAGEPLVSDGSATAASRVLGSEDSGPSDVISDRLLTVRFRKSGSALVAISIDASSTVEEAPIY